MAGAGAGIPLSAARAVGGVGVGPEPVEWQKSRRLEPLSADRYGVHFTADGEFRELLERVRGLAGHRLPNGNLMPLLERARGERARTVEAALRPGREAAPRRCSARRTLELDHIEPWAVGGEATPMSPERWFSASAGANGGSRHSLR
ncbi:MAG TPA: hypothetical protein VJV79_18490 [Polyangiaceae bacterium]|nr:hypothetical protein [Polyangiaceae bacterium]